MNSGNWTKLYGNTIYSTVWQEPPAIRCVWITMLAISDFEGYVGASVPGLAKAANVSMEETLAALERFQGPDEFSRTKEHDGRRIEEVDGGWRILNFVAHRDGNENQRDKWARQKRQQRANKKKGAGAGHGKPLAGEQAYEKALERGDEAGAEKVLAGLEGEGKGETADGGKGVLPGPVVARDEPAEPAVAVSEPESESGYWEDGQWVKD